MEEPATHARGRVRHDVTLLTADDLYLFNEGTHQRLYERLGAHPLVTDDGEAGTYFAVWAPNAASVSVVGDWNGWERGAHPLAPRGGSGLWEGFLPGVGVGALYKYALVSRTHGHRTEKADPFALRAETPPRTASIVSAPRHEWGDAGWLAARARRDPRGAPLSIYEVHLGSWRRVPEEGNRVLTYRELAPRLRDYALEMGFTHVELLPIMEHPFFGSWGYQTTGYFAPTARHGAPEDLMALVDVLHQAGIGVLLDWVPSHFPTDAHGLAFFDGTHLFEHEDPRQGFHPDWRSAIFNYGRHEVRSFLVSSALFWLDRYHVDGLRVDAVASMLYLDYSRPAGAWVPNRHGGRENLDAIALLRALNEAVHRSFPGAITVAEESTAWPRVTRPAAEGGLGFTFKWDMGWMHDTLRYAATDPVFRRHHHELLTFRFLYAWSERYVLPLSHDEVVHGKGSLLGKMPGDDWRRFAGLRLLLGLQHGQPGKKLLFMGGELGQVPEWSHESSLEWHVLAYPFHRGVQRWVRDLNALHRREPALHELDVEPAGFEWVDCHDREQSVVTFLRRARDRDAAPVLVACNFTPVPRPGYRVGVPCGGTWRELLNSDAREYEGSGVGNQGSVEAQPVPFHGRPWSLVLTLPPLGVLFLHAG